MKKRFILSRALAWALAAALGLGLAATAQANEPADGTVKAKVTKTSGRVGHALKSAAESTKRGAKRAGVAVSHVANLAGSRIKKVMPQNTAGQPSRINPDAPSAARDAR
jgi:hypothetical protein